MVISGGLSRYFSMRSSPIPTSAVMSVITRLSMVCAFVECCLRFWLFVFAVVVAVDVECAEGESCDCDE